MEQRRINRNSKTRFFPDSAGKKWFACWRTASSGIYRFMSTPDDFSTYVADLLSGTYDCVDRICVRGYFPLGQTSGGLLTWWNPALSQHPAERATIAQAGGGLCPACPCLCSQT